MKSYIPYTNEQVSKTMSELFIDDDSINKTLNIIR